jgi:DNA-directed RNA polymerase III subunit RPC3
MTTNQINVASLLVKEHFGDFLEAVVTVLLKSGKQNLVQLRHHLPSKEVSKIRAALRVLLRHGMLSYEKHSRGFTEYAADINKILMITKYPQMMLSAKEMYGDDAEVIIEELLQKGSMTMVQVWKYPQ